MDPLLGLLGWPGEGANCPTNSFSADTLVETAQGDRPIGNLHIGDAVLAYDEASGTPGYYPITAVIVHTDTLVERLTLDGEELTTANHPFYTTERAWVKAGNLWPGAHIRKADGRTGMVRAVHIAQQPQLMYNLTVAGAHTFFVGRRHWLVHNSTCAPNWNRIAKIINDNPAGLGGGGRCRKCAQAIAKEFQKAGIDVKMAYGQDRCCWRIPDSVSD